MNWSDLAGGLPLRWVQPSMWKMNYQLVRGDAVIATLRLKGASGSQATVENADGCWTFEQRGFLHPRVFIRRCDSKTEVATFRSDWKGGGTFEFENGRHIRVTTNLWQTRLHFTLASGESLMSFNYDGVWCTAATVGLQAAALSSPETSWMVAFGWYLMVMMQNCALAAVLPFSVAYSG